MAEKIATRESYGNALAELGDKYDIVVLDADLSKSTKTATFQKKFPERFINCGIAEGNMMSVAAGLASTGKIVFASSFAMFAAERAFEQVRNSIAYPHLNVKIGASHAGLSVGEDGATHQCNEDIALMRSIPGMIVLNPADDTEARACVRAAVEYDGPMYLRFGRLAVPVVFDRDTFTFEIGKAHALTEGSDVAIAATGLMVNEALCAAELLKNDGIRARVIDVCTIKPIDKEMLAVASRECGAIVTAEEHSIFGGLGSAVCEAVCETAPCPVVRVGVEDVFGSSGPAKDVLAKYGLTAENIAAKAKQAIALKQQ